MKFWFIRFSDYLCLRLWVRLGLGVGFGFNLDGSRRGSTLRSSLTGVYRRDELRIDIAILRGVCRGRRYFYPNSI